MLSASSCQRRQWFHHYTYEPPAPAARHGKATPRHLDKCYAVPQNIQSFDDPSSKGKIATFGPPPGSYVTQWLLPVSHTDIQNTTLKVGIGSHTLALAERVTVGKSGR